MGLTRGLAWLPAADHAVGPMRRRHGLRVLVLVLGCCWLATACDPDPVPDASNEASTCNADTVNDVAEIPYTADYHFWKSTGS